MLILCITVLWLLLSCDDALPCCNCGLDLCLPLSLTGSLLQNLVSLVYSNGVLVKLADFFLLFITYFFIFKPLDGLADDFHKVLLQSLLLQNQSVLVPYEIGHLRIPSILLHTALKEPQNIFVVRVLSELELATVVHELAEFLGVTLAQLIDGNLELLLLDIVVLLIL